ncbi:MAG TPA: preprotein translocase subunit SecE [Candidatus Acidoferrales bacterium]|nr:preprotein translocase subunit SecE [Candidatus Acidoferrales bacterium]
MNKPTGGSSTTRTARTASTQEFFRGLVSEMRRVTWPTQQEWMAATILTIALVVGVGVFTWAIDEIFSKLFGLIR